MRNKFYIASAYSRRPRSKLDAEWLAEQTGMDCTAVWLSGEYDDWTPEVGASDDLQHIALSGWFIVLMPGSENGGMWVELGYALAQHEQRCDGTPKIVVVIDPNQRAVSVDGVYPESAAWPSVEPIFCALPNVQHVMTLGDLAKMMGESDAG